jgi:4,5:9,10-diseco-3-hydroxy-5,9,17-trioxoandrosta-1(10),2-diene-4-oate hydrolase
MVGPIIQRLRAIQRPTLVVWGRQDPVLPVAHAEVVGTGIPNARVEILEQCGHALMLEQTEAFTGLLLDFLSD